MSVSKADGRLYFPRGPREGKYCHSDHIRGTAFPLFFWSGTHNSGVKYARANLFSGAPMVIVPPTYDDIALLGKVKNLLAPMGFGSITVSTADEHDRMIAFTSQLAHVVSNAYVKSPTARAHKGFSAGSYKDMTRVAWLNV